MKTFVLATTAAELLSWPYYINLIIGFVVAIMQAIVLAFLTKIVIDKSLRKSKSIGDGLSKIGIEKVEFRSGKMSISDQNVLFGRNGKQKPAKIKLCFLTGVNFFFDYQEDLRELVKSGTKIQVLLLNPLKHTHYEEYKKDLENYDVFQRNFPKELRSKIIERCIRDWELKDEPFADLPCVERAFLMLSSAYLKKLPDEKKYNTLDQKEKWAFWDARLHSYGNDITEIIIARKLLKEINSHSQNGGGIQLHFYTDEYQMPITLAEYDYGNTSKNKSFVLLWTNMNAPVRETIKSVNVLAMKDGNQDAAFVEDMNASFDYLIEKYPKDYLASEE